MKIEQFYLIALCLLTMAFSACVPVVMSAEAATNDNSPAATQPFSQTYADAMRAASISVQETAAEMKESGWGQVDYGLVNPE